MLILTKAEITQILSGRSLPQGGEVMIEGVEFDSRLVRKGVLFIALPGEKIHGHTFIEDAISKGASLCLVEDEALLKVSPVADRLIAVADSLQGLQALGKYARGLFKGPVVGVTGTIGKTTTRNILAAILAEENGGNIKVNASKKSFNNHIGVPYTLCNSDRNAAFTVLEMGMNHSGELTVLSQIAQPDVAIVTNVTPVHMEFFNDLGEVAAAKCEIFSGLKLGGTRLINIDVPELVRGLAQVSSLAKTSQSNATRTLTLGTSKISDYQITQVVDELTDGFTLEMKLPTESIKVRVPMIGAYNAINVAAAIACATHIAPNLSQGDIQRALDKIKPEAHRLNLIKLNSGKELLDDCYNSSPTAMLSVLKLLSACKSRGKRIGLVLGGMHEMGDHVEHYHQIVAAEIIKLAPEFCFVVGEVGKNYISALKDANFPVKWFAAPTEVVAPLDAATFDLALVKGSRGVRLDLLIDETLSNLNTAC
jgi:UDP-N-acetylmuramoyl-tripeptide--D-alanyl-D-alanine ligase